MYPAIETRASLTLLSNQRLCLTDPVPVNSLNHPHPFTGKNLLGHCISNTLGQLCSGCTHLRGVIVGVCLCGCACATVECESILSLFPTHLQEARDLWSALQAYVQPCKLLVEHGQRLVRLSRHSNRPFATIETDSDDEGERPQVGQPPGARSTVYCCVFREVA